jgi:large conductance mechanosensitive channel
VLKAAEMGADGKETAAEVAIAWGSFITAAIDFLVVAFVMFLVIRAINSMKRKAAEAPAAPPAEVTLLTEIRDLLKK